MNNTKSINLTLILAGAVFLLIGYNLIEAWTVPGGNPPANNVSTPINVSSAYQIKDGVLGLDALAIFAANPRIQFVDETAGQRDIWQYLDADTFFILTDRTGDNSPWTGDSPHPMKMYIGATSSDDYVQFSDQVRATEYCDQNGNNCGSFAPTAEEKILKIFKISQWTGDPSTASVAAAQAYWNNNIITPTDANGGPTLKASFFGEECIWSPSEIRPLYNAGTMGGSEADRMEWCALQICRAYPSRPAGAGYVDISYGSHCGTGSPSCPMGHFSIACLY